MKHINLENGTFVMNMLVVDPRTGNGERSLVKCSIEDAIACELVTQQEIDAARQARLDQTQKGLSAIIRLQDKEEAEMDATSSIHDTIYKALDLIQDLRNAKLEIGVESVKQYLNEKVSNDFIRCVIRFESEIQAIVAKKMVWEPETPQPDPVEREAFYQATGKDAPLGRYQIAAGAIRHPNTGLWQIWLSTNGFDFSQLAAFKEQHKATNAVELIKLEAQSGTFYDEELVIDFYLFLKEQSDGKALPLPDDLVRKLGRDILHAVIDMPQAETVEPTPNTGPIHIVRLSDENTSETEDRVRTLLEENPTMPVRAVAHTLSISPNTAHRHITRIRKAND